MGDTRYKPHTDADDERLIQYLATHDVRTGSASTYQSIVNNEDGTSPWGAERTWAAWRSRYAHHKHDFDRRIRQYRLKHGMVHRDDSGQSSNDQTQTTSSHFESPSPFGVSSAAGGSITGLNALPACNTTISSYPSLPPATISPSKNMHLTLIAERVISSNRYSKPTSRRNSDTWMKDPPSLPSLSSRTNPAADGTSDLPQKMTEDHHLFMTVGLLTGSAQPSGFSENSLTSPSFSDTYEPSASNRHEEETPSPALHTLPARMARKRQRPSITDHEHEPLFSAQTSETQTSALTPVKELSEMITHDDHRAQEPKRIRTDSNKPRTKDEKTELPINIQSPRRLSRSDSRSSKMSQPKKALSSHAPMVPLVGRNAPRHDQVSKFSEFDNPSDTDFADVLGLNYVSERKFRFVKGEKDDLKNLKSVPVVSESRDSVERGLSAPRLSQNLTKTGDDGDDQGHQVKKARAVKKPSPSSGPSPLVSIPSGLGWGGLGHLVG